MGLKNREGKIARRLAQHLKLIERRPGITTRELLEASEGVTTLKTIQDDLRYLREHWKEGELRSKGGRHWLRRHKSVEELELEEEQRIYIKLALEATEEMQDLSEHGETIARELGLDRLESPYYVKSESYEPLDTDDEEVKELEEAIRWEHPILFRYRGKDFHVAPLRLVNFDGIWYLYGKDLEEREDNPWKTWLVSEIETPETDHSRKHDVDDERVEEVLEEAPSPHFIPDHRVQLRIRVASEVAEIFRLKEHLPEQRIERVERDGSLLVHAEASTYEDVEREIKSWLPHLRILEPAEYRRRLVEELRGYLASEE